MSIVENFRIIGAQLFSREDVTELRFPLEHATLCVGLSNTNADNALEICEYLTPGDSGKISNQNGITLIPWIDQQIALRLAGLLIAWAETNNLHEPAESMKGKIVALENWPDPVTVQHEIIVDGRRYVEFMYGDGSYGIASVDEIGEAK